MRQLTNSAGVVTDTYEYDAFGNSFNETGTTPNNYLYRGEQYDSDLGLYYLRARYYNPLTGRFLSRDPLNGNAIDPASLHKYLYAGGDPVNALDPTGTEALFIYTGLIRNRALAAIGFGTRMGIRNVTIGIGPPASLTTSPGCINAGFSGLSDALNAAFSGAQSSTNVQQVAAQLETCATTAIKGLLGLLLGSAAR